jgi:S1-C subfamily serine protease
MLSPIKYEAVASQKGALEGRRFRIFLGTIPDYSQEGVQGVRISGASKDSPAAVAGLQANDIIVELNQQKIENLYDYVYALQLLTAGKEAVMKIKRPQATGVFQELDLKIVPDLKE